ncbi:MAG: alpha/beta hydrolase [Acidimicrobiales bacterium]|nr:alpha/beta hydrolase [Acidimicrobiales bacterium]
MELDQHLDPEVAAVVADFPELKLDESMLPAVRSRPLAPPPELSGAVQRDDHVIPGDPDVLVRVHRAVDATGPRAAVVSIHGGGLVTGSYEGDDLLFDRWCSSLDVVGIAVEYRLAPENPYPAALDDCDAALAWVHEHADELGVDRTRVGVRGVSAGGGLAAALALRVRDRGESSVAFQLLDCPMLDDRQITPSSQLDGLPIWSRESNAFGWRSYLGDLHGTDDVPDTAAPARATDLRGLPPAYVSVGSADGFRDEDIDYALRLNQAGVPCELHVHPGAPHGYHLAASSQVARRSFRDATAWLARQVGVASDL